MTHGLDFARNRARVAKLSTPAAMALGPLARREVLPLADPAFLAYRRRETIALRAEDIPRGVTPGAVILEHQGTFQGIGLLFQENGTWTLESQFPKAWVRDNT